MEEQKSNKTERQIKADLFREICEELVDNYVRKNRDYGDSFSKTYDRFGLVSPVTRLNDKVNRLNSLVYQERNVKDETVNDTLKDLASYSIMTLIDRRLNK